MTDDIYAGRAFVNGGTINPGKKSTPTTRAADGNGDGDVSRQKFQLKDQIMGDRRLCDSCRRVLYFLIDWYGYEGRDYTFTRHERLAEYTGLTTRTVRRCIVRLVKLGYIAVKRRGRWGLASEYSVTNLSPHMRTQLCPHVNDAYEDTAVTAHEDTAVTAHEDTAVSTHPLPSRSVSVGKGRTDAGGACALRRSRPAPGRKAAPEAGAADPVSVLLDTLMALPWVDTSLRARRATKRVLAEVMALPDAPSPELLLAKARDYLAIVPRKEQRWPHIWMQDKGWLCVERAPKEAAKPERASKAKGASKKKAKGKAKPRRAELDDELDDEPESIERQFPAGRIVWVKDGGAKVTVLGVQEDSTGTYVEIQFGWGLIKYVKPEDLLFEDPYTPEERAAREAEAKRAFEARLELRDRLAAEAAQKAEAKRKAEEERARHEAEQAREYKRRCEKTARHFPVGSRVDFMEFTNCEVFEVDGDDVIIYTESCAHVTAYNAVASGRVVLTAPLAPAESEDPTCAAGSSHE